MIDFETASAAYALPAAGCAGGSSWIEAAVRPYADEVRTDANGNVFARVGGGDRRLAFLAHADARGFVASFVEQSGAVRFLAPPWDAGETPAGTRVRFENGIKGVIAADGTELAVRPSGGARAHSDYYIDIGSESAEETLRSIRPGDRAVRDFLPHTGDFGAVCAFDAGLVGAKTLLCALKTIRTGGVAPKNDLLFVFGRSGNEPFDGTAVYEGLNVSAAIAVGAYHTAPGSGGTDAGVRIGAGPVATAKADLYFSPSVYGAVLEAASRLNVALQHSVQAHIPAADAMMESDEGVVAAALGIPVRGGRIYRESDVGGAARIVAELGGTRWM
ncbi:MAG: hypothetical protein LBO81_01490 [Clostridiales Family XIII bacterium]|jgi:endoglucanase|nr:hypothetical protein [Clostridiales Family XIII bacterium]